MASPDEFPFPKLKLDTKPLIRSTSSPLTVQLEGVKDALQQEDSAGLVRDGTPPIDIPSGPSSRRPTPAIALKDTAIDDSSFIPPELFLPESISTSLLSDDRPIRPRGSSISFHPHVTSDSGQCLPLQGAADSTPPVPPVRDHSGSPPVAGQELYNRDIQSQEAFQHKSIPNELFERQPHRSAPRSNEVRRILLQTPDNGLSNDSDLEQEKILSLTSATTTPSIDEARTPLETVVEYFMASPVEISTSQQGNAIESWPQRNESRRARSYRAERSTGSLRKSSRRASTKSITTSVSPASAFLAQWGHTHGSGDSGPLVPQDPDAEGMEIGDHSQYIIGKEVGHGGFSVVKEVHTFEDDVRVTRAVKIVRKNIEGKSEMENEKLQSEFEREVEIWRYLKHPYILPLLAVYDTPFATFCITKLNVGGTLFDLVRANRRRARLNTVSLTASPELKAKPTERNSEESNTSVKGLSLHLAKRYIYQLASALRYLHEDLHVVHRDVKLENCLVDMSRPGAATKGGNILLCDFGMADWSWKDSRTSPEPFDHDDGGNMNRSMTSTSIAGSLNYAAPEMLNEPDQLYTTGVDMWAFGVVAYALLTGDLPFAHTFEPRLVTAISKGEYDISNLRNAPAVQEAAQDTVEMVMGCLELNTDLRWTIADVLESRWLEGCRELYEEVDCAWT